MAKMKWSLANSDRKKENEILIILLILSGVVLGIQVYFYKAPLHVWIGFYSLLGVVICSKFFVDVYLVSALCKTMALLLAVVISYCIFKLSVLLGFDSDARTYVAALKFLFFPFAIYFSGLFCKTVKI
ncbi:MAG: hypothetical protein LBS14_02975 [Holosporaceae bacterium]|nr:hypothetical protein [Holosporaceae bacterium]